MSKIVRTLSLCGALPLLLLGSMHLAYAVKDVLGFYSNAPMKYFGPGGRLSPGGPALDAALPGWWAAYFGFHISHSLGLLLVGGAALVLATGIHHAFGYQQLTGCLPAFVFISAIYALMAAQFWFWVPAVGLLCSMGFFLVALLFRGFSTSVGKPHKH
eukprot:GILJ01011844.1.p1 GENE.GILJ01011844.1~~GILJ01011844.1.p1  ORF type:complete len:173 (-),score=10.21 GILJ01011844.1:227-700(-)